MFKFCPFSEYSLTNLLNHEIFLNHVNKFNDPFECQAKVLTGFPPKDPDCQRFMNIIRAWGFETPDEIALENYDLYISSLDDREPSVDLEVDSARISCFSKNGSNLLMWSHYADGLRGFCIEFDPQVIRSSCDMNTNVYDVLYESSPAIIDTAVIAVLDDQYNYHGDAIYEAERLAQCLGVDRSAEIEAYKCAMKDAATQSSIIFQKMLATKPKEWEYEQEIRLISGLSTSNEAAFFKYPPGAIKSLIVGEKMPLKQQETLRRVAAQHPTPIALKTAVRAPGEFKVIFETDI